LVGQLAAIGFEGFLQDEHTLDCFIPKDVWDKEIEKRLHDLLGRFRREFPIVRTKFDLRVVKEQNWNAAWERSVGIVEVTDRIIIKPSWMKRRKKDRTKIVLTIDPKMSFGTGHHESTRLAILALRDHLQPGSRVLDFGCGTGIVALAAAKLGALSAIGVDNDSWAVQNARENVRLNHASQRVKIVEGGASSIPSRSFDLIIANIDLPTITAHLSRLLRSLRFDGKLILSGLLTTDLSALMDRLTHKNALPLEVLTENEWSALVLTKIRAR
jgi:ribosomal protein L11 methyltransferase